MDKGDEERDGIMASVTFQKFPGWNFVGLGMAVISCWEAFFAAEPPREEVFRLVWEASRDCTKGEGMPIPLRFLNEGTQLWNDMAEFDAVCLRHDLRGYTIVLNRPTDEDG